MEDFNDIRIATIKDRDVVFDLFHRCTQNLIDSGSDQWSFDYPNTEILEKDLSQNEMWIIRNKQDLATITLNDYQDPKYNDVTWQFNDQPILVIHRVAVDPNSRGRGLGKHLCLFAEYYGRKMGYKSIRLDAYSASPVSMSLYNGLMYLKTKESIFFEGPSMPVYCFEKKL